MRKTPKGLEVEPVGTRAGVLANALVFAVLVYAWILEAWDFDLYRAAVQEDEYLEWATFWSFLAAAAVFAWAAIKERRAGGGFPWFSAGLSVFCFLFAMEEISWAQRIFAYRPPTYFLEHNFQQEPNFHNVISTDLRKLTLKAIIGGYGVVLPLLLRVPDLARWARRWGIWAPPLAFAPAFVACYYTYEVYPWQYAGEIVELMLGLAFLFVALVALERTAGRRGPLERSGFIKLSLATLLVFALGLATAAAVRSQQSLWPESIKAAQAEVEAMKADVLAVSDVSRRRFPTRCGLHRRVYTFVDRYEAGAAALRGGRYEALQEKGLPEERADYFIDPWNAPYWIRDRCSDATGRRSIFIYSFGPNRKRDSSRWEVLGDDIGVYVFVDPGRGGEAADDPEDEERDD